MTESLASNAETASLRNRRQRFSARSCTAACRRSLERPRRPCRRDRARYRDRHPKRPRQLNRTRRGEVHRARQTGTGPIGEWRVKTPVARIRRPVSKSSVSTCDQSRTPQDPPDRTVPNANTSSQARALARIQETRRRARHGASERSVIAGHRSQKIRSRRLGSCDRRISTFDCTTYRPSFDCDGRSEHVRVAN